jgi:CRISPR-associated protein Csm1
MNMRDLSIILAACLHDVGKFYRRACRRRERHEALSREFVEEYVPEFQGKELVRDIVARHHERPVDEAAKIVIDADRLSAAERREEESEQGYRSEMRRMRDIFAAHDGDHRTPALFYKIGPLDLRDYKSILEGDAREEASTNEYRSLWDAFLEDVERLRGLYSDGMKDDSSLRHYIKTLLELLREYMFFMPSAPSVEVEVRNSLYAHHKTTAALASAMLLNKRNNSGDMFTLILGDVAGIQRYVYGSRAYKGALKMLRARSIYLSMLTEAIARHIVNRLGLLPLNIIFCSGGHFMILAHYVGEDELGGILKEVEGFLLREQRGLIGLKLSHAYMSREDFMDRRRFKDKLGEAMRGLGESGLRLFRRMMHDYFDGVFGPIPVKDETCYSCGGTEKVEAEVVDGREIYLCDRCRSMRELAKELKDARYMLAISWGGRITKPEDLSIDEPEHGIYTGPLNFTASGLSVSYHLCKDLDSALRLIHMFLWQGFKPVDVDVYKINDTDLGGDLERLRALGRNKDYEDIARRVGLGFKFISKHTPISGEDGDIREFDEMAKASRGSKMVGYLKLDVDGLGRRLREYCETISDLLTFSETISFIMEGCIEHMLSLHFSGDDLNRLYLIYSGGDDLFLVGSWDAVVEAADRIYKELRGILKMDYGGPTISAAILVEDPKTPVKICSEIVSEKLRSVKEAGKNGINIVGGKVSWDGFTRSLETAKRLSRYIEEGVISRGLIFQLSRLISDYEDDPEKAWTVYRYRLKYIMARSLEKGVRGELEGKLLMEDFYRELCERFIHLTNIAYLAELYTRREGWEG